MSKNKQDSIKLEESTPILGDADFQAVHHQGGLSITSTVFFLIGEIIGVGALALPNSLARSSYPGVFTIVCASVIAITNGTQLGWCWTLLLQRHPEYRTHCRYPYSAIGQTACGKWMKYVVSVCIAFTCFGLCVIYLLLAAENLHSMLLQAGVNINFCLVMVVFAGFLVPLSWFGSPKDFMLIALLAFASATAALILVFAQFMLETPPPDSIHHHYPSGVRVYFLSFGAILAAYSGASTFPTIQHDMKKPKQFTIALVISYSYCAVVYLTIAVSGYYVYGETVVPNILLRLPNGPIKITVMALYVIHLVFAYILFLNPPIQNIEEALKIPNTKCNWRRILLRSSSVLIILFLAETSPHFGALVDLFGASSSAFLTFIAPPIFYMLLCRNGYRDDTGRIRYLSIWLKLYNSVVIIVGIIVACVTTYAAIVQLSSPSTFVPPCYVNWTAAEMSIAS